MDRDDGGPAFPVDAYELASAGMSLRDYFAAKAMEGLIRGPDYDVQKADGTFCQTFADVVDVVAQRAYQYADAMLAERSKP